MTYNIIFYIFAVIIIASALISTFSKSISPSIFTFFLIMTSITGFYTLLHSELFALVNILFISGTGITLLIFHNKLNITAKLVSEDITKTPLVSTLIVSLMIAIISSILASTRWKSFDLNYEINTNALIFNKYLPLVILITMTTAVIISSIKFILKKETK